MKIVHLTSVHHPFDVRIFQKECRTLAQAGYEVVLIAPHERDETVEGVGLRAVPIPRSRPERMIRTTWQIFKTALDERADVYHFHDPELIPLGLLLKLLGKRVVYDVHEEFPKQILNKHWIWPWLRGEIARVVDVVEHFSSLAFDGIVAATPAIARRFPKGRTFIVQNFPIPDELASGRLCMYAERPFGVAYVGGMTTDRGIKEIVKAVAMVPESLRARLLLVGTFDPPGLENEIRKIAGWNRVDFLGWQTREGVARALGLARAGLVLLHPRPNFLESFPIKLFEYMSVGIPVIASDFPLWRQIIQDAGCGLLADPLDHQSIARAIQWLLENPAEAEAMGLRGMQAVRSHFNWNSEGEKLLNLYQTLAPTAPQASLAAS